MNVTNAPFERAKERLAHIGVDILRFIDFETTITTAQVLLSSSLASHSLPPA